MLLDLIVYLHMTDKASTLSSSQMLCLSFYCFVVLPITTKTHCCCAIFNTETYSRLSAPEHEPILIQNNYCCQKMKQFSTRNFCVQYNLAISLSCVCHPSDWVWQRFSNNSLFWLGTPCLLLLSQCLWGLATAHWRSYMTVKRAINAGREAEVYGCFSLP